VVEATRAKRITADLIFGSDLRKLINRLYRYRKTDNRDESIRRITTTVGLSKCVFVFRVLKELKTNIKMIYWCLKIKMY
jgi:hypothetical protein